MPDLLFRLLGDGSGVAAALDAVEGNGKKVAGVIAGAFAGMQLSKAFSESMNEGQIAANFAATTGKGITEGSKAAVDEATALYRDGWGTSLQQVADSTKAVMARMGGSLEKDGKAAFDSLVTGTLSVAQGLNTNVTDVSRAAGQMMKNGMAPDAQTALDIMTRGLQNGANRSGDLLATLEAYGPTFNKMGIDGSTATGLIVNGLNAGAQNADVAAKGLMMMYKTVSTDGPQANKAFKLMGLDSKDMADKITAGGPAAKEATGQVIEALSKMTDPVAQQQAGVLLFGRSWKSSSAEIIAAMNPMLVKTDETKDATQKMGDIMHDTQLNKVDSLKRSFEGWKTDLMATSGPIGDIGVALVAFGGPATATLGSLSLIASGLKDFGLFSKVAAAGQWLLNAAMSANPIGLVIAAIAALVAGFVWLWNNSEGFREFWIGLWDKIKAAVSAVADWFSTTWQTVIGAVTGFFTGLWDAITGGVTAAVQWVSDKWTGFSNFIGGVVSGIGQFFAQLGLNIYSYFTNTVSWIEGLWSSFTGWIYGIASSIAGFFTSAWDWVYDRAAWIIDKVIGAFQWMKDQITSIMSTIAEGVSNTNMTLPSVSLGGGLTPHASGGVIMPRPGGRAILAGEAGEPEAVVPLSKWDSMTGGQGGGNITINLGAGVIFGTPAELAQKLNDVVALARRQGAGSLPAFGGT